MEELYQPILNWIDPDLHLLKVTDTSECQNSRPTMPNTGIQLPSMAIMVFLHEEGMVGFERIQSVKRNFEKAPWKFHHSEQVHRGAINPYPYNSQDFYYTSENLPLWAIRQVHYGKEHIRTVLFVSEGNWEPMVQFYKLLVGSEPDTKREDFCLFTVHSHIHFDVQLALKKLQSDTKPRVLENVKIQFRVNDISNIMQMFPNVCRPLSDSRWETTDNDGNVIVIEIPGFGSSVSDHGSVSDTSSISGRTLSIRMGSLSYKRMHRSGSTKSSQSRRQRIYDENETNNNNVQIGTETIHMEKNTPKINLKQYLIQPTLQINKENRLPRLPKTSTAKKRTEVNREPSMDAITSRQTSNNSDTCRQMTKSNEIIRDLPIVTKRSSSFRSKSPVDETFQTIKQSNIDFQTKIEAIAKELHKKLSSLPHNDIDINQNEIGNASVSFEENKCESLKGFYV